VAGAALRLLRLGPRPAAHLLRERLSRRLDGARERRRDAAGPSFGAAEGPVLPRLLAPFDAAALPGAQDVLAIAALHLEHRFDLLGSGWVRVRHGMECRGVEGHRYPSGPSVEADAAGAWLAGRVSSANLVEARRVWAMVDAGYAPLDWQLDFKSGYRWDGAARFDRIAFGTHPGADVKVPWELGRLQHLPRLAWAYALARAGTPSALDADRYAREFRNQVLDFIAQNPPRYGVSWASPMDVAIRAANLVVAHDLFRAWGAAFDDAFTAELARSVRAHARHVAAHLEWHPRLRGNHYLSNVAGLLFAAAFLPAGGEADAWLAFGVQELLGEAAFQFEDDGTNFEASTAYHRLSAEMVLLSTAVVLGLPDERVVALRAYDRRHVRRGPGLRRAPLAMFRTGDEGRETPFPPDHAARLRRMAGFTARVLKPGNRAHLVGDDDSGRFLKLWPACETMTAGEARARWATLDPVLADDLPDDATWPAERHLDHRGLLATAAALGVGVDAPSSDAADEAAADGALARALAGGAVLGRDAGEDATAAVRVRAASSLPGPGADARRYVFAVQGGGARAGLALFAYPRFGLYIYRSGRVYLAVRCGGVRHGTGGHAHADALALELAVDGVDWIADPGSYLYTALPEARDRYRSVAAHFAPRVGASEPVRLGPGPFATTDRSAARCLRFDEDGFAGTHVGYGVPVYRQVEITDDEVRVTDWAEGAALEPLEVRAGALAVRGGMVADAYGRRAR